MKRSDFLQMFKECLEDGAIKIVVNINPQYAESGSGQWNITRTSVWVGDECIDIDYPGEVNMCDPI